MMAKIKPKIKKSFIADSFFKIGELVEGEFLGAKGREAYIDLGKATGIIFGREYLEAVNVIKKLKRGDKVKAKIIELDGEGGYIELSLKEAFLELEEGQLKEVFSKGEIVEARVVGANRGGLLLQYRNFSGFLPTSQMSKEHFPKGKTDQEILDQLQKFIGQTFKVKIFNYSPKQKKVIFTEKGVKEGTIQESLQEDS